MSPIVEGPAGSPLWTMPHADLFDQGANGLLFRPTRVVIERQLLDPTTWHFDPHSSARARTSVFSRLELEQSTRRFLRNQDLLIDSITETLTGYILQKAHPDCRSGWIEGRYPECSIGGYKPRVRLWCSVCQHIGIEKIAEFYFSNSESYIEPWNQLQESVQEMGYLDFRYNLNDRIPYNEMSFREMAFRSIPGLKDTYENRERARARVRWFDVQPNLRFRCNISFRA